MAATMCAELIEPVQDLGQLTPLRRGYLVVGFLNADADALAPISLRDLNRDGAVFFNVCLDVQESAPRWVPLFS